METLLLSPPEIPGKTRPPITLWATWLRLSSAMTADTCTGARSQRSGDRFLLIAACQSKHDEGYKDSDVSLTCRVHNPTVVLGCVICAVMVTNSFEHSQL